MIRRPVWIEAVICSSLAVGLAAGIAAGAPQSCFAPVGLLVSLVASGWLLFIAISRRRPSSLVDVGLCVAGSVGLLVALGIAIDAVGFALTPKSWAVALAVVFLGLSVISLVRGRPATAVAKNRTEKVRFRRRHAAPLILHLVVPSVLCVGLVGAAAYITVDSQRSATANQRLTELWLTGEGRQQVVHVWNREGGPVDYRVGVSVRGTAQPIRSVSLNADEKWSLTVDVGTEPPPSAAMPLSVVLYRGADTTVYREVHLNRAGR